MRLLSKDNETVYPPEFHKALNLEYKVRYHRQTNSMCAIFSFDL